MVLGAFLTEIIVAFLLAGTLLYKYGNVFRHHIIVTISVLIAWYFSLLIIFILPLDVSSVIMNRTQYCLNNFYYNYMYHKVSLSNLYH